MEVVSCWLRGTHIEDRGVFHRDVGISLVEVLVLGGLGLFNGAMSS